MELLRAVQRAQEQCACCGQRREDLLLCPCQQVYYCSTTCQLQHWRTSHRSQCTKGERGEPKLKFCYHCGKGSFHIRRCRCGMAYYCDVECQRHHWSQHRPLCSLWDVPEQPTIFRIRRLDVAVQTDPLMFMPQALSLSTSSGSGNPLVLDSGGRAGEPTATNGSGDMTANSLAGSIVSRRPTLPPRRSVVIHSATPSALAVSTLFSPTELAIAAAQDANTDGGRGRSSADIGVGGSDGNALVHVVSAFDSGQPTTTEDDDVGASVLTDLAGASSNPLLSMTGQDEGSLLRHAAFPSAARNSVIGGAGVGQATILVRKGTVMSNVLTSTAAHLSRNRTLAFDISSRYSTIQSGVFTSGSSRNPYESNLDTPTNQSQQEALAERESELLREELFLLEEETRHDIFQERREQLVLASQALRKLRLIDAAKKLSAEEQERRVHIVTQFNVWWRSYAAPVHKRIAVDGHNALRSLEAFWTAPFAF